MVSLAPGTSIAAQAGAVPVLDRVVEVSFVRTPLPSALLTLRHDRNIPLAFSGDLIPPGRLVTLTMRGPLREILAALLRGTGLAFAMTARGTVVIVPERRGTGSVPRVAGDRSLADLIAATGVRELDQVVVMGTPVRGAPAWGQPSAVGIAEGDDVRRHRFISTADFLRNALPGVVFWDPGPGGPPAAVGAARGVSSFTTRALKTYVDGVEVASPDLILLLDPRSIERVEVLRGPQGAALYGADAINGVIQVVTRKGRWAARSSPRVWGVVSGGSLDRSADGTNLRQAHGLGVTVDGEAAAGEIGGRYQHVGNAGVVPWAQSWSVQGGGRVVAGPVVVEGSARGGRHEFLEQQLLDLRTLRRIDSVPEEIRTVGGGITATQYFSESWYHTVVAGVDHAEGAIERARPLLLAPRFPLGATHVRATRASVRYNMVSEVPIGRAVRLTGTLGAEHSSLNQDRGVVGDGETAGDRRRVTTVLEDDADNSGVFGQVRLRFGERVLVTGGTRAEWSSTVGDQAGPAWASTVGAVWTIPAGRHAFRVRGSWGRAIRPPTPGMSAALTTGTFEQQANPGLGSEIQRGGEAGVEFHSDGGARVAVTFFDQRADGLIQPVTRPRQTRGTTIYQFQNVGAIDNRGIEVEASFVVGAFEFQGAHHVTDSEVRRLAPGYTGELRVGDDVPEVPSSTSTLSLTWARGGFRLSAGAARLGSWRGWDVRALFRAEQSPDPLPEDLSPFLVRFPSLFRPWLSLSVDLRGRLSAFASVDNPGGSERLVRDNGSPPVGRSVNLGVEVRP